MKFLNTLIAIALLTTSLAVAPAVAGDSHTATQSDIHDALETNRTPVEQQRDAVRSFLARPEVRNVADNHGIDASTLEDAVSTMSAEDMAPVMAQIGEYEESLAGGDRIVLTSTAVIIILLIIILIIVA